jgi:hypothetical protein
MACHLHSFIEGGPVIHSFTDGWRLSEVPNEADFPPLKQIKSSSLFSFDNDSVLKFSN